MADKKLVGFVGGVVLVAFVFFALANVLFFSNSAATTAAASPAPVAGDAVSQTVTLTATNAGYSPSVITAQAGKPLKLIGDVSKLPGCSRSFVIPAFNVRKVFTPTDNVVEFTPNQKGSFAFSCSMGMYRGTINVV